jgi:phosphatidylglycerophosphate synthase
MSHRYDVHDKSLLAEPLKRFLWRPLLAFVPLWFSANTMTLVGTLINILGAVIALIFAPTRLSSALVAFMVFAYLCIDNMDGAQARRTGTSSPLGEFLDHWLDGINGTMLCLGALVSWEATGLRGLFVIALTGLAYSLTMWEQRWTGRAHFGRLGNIEGILGVSLMYALQSALGNELFCRRPLVLGQSLSDLFVWLSLGASSLTALGPLFRVGRLCNVPAIALAYALPLFWFAMRPLPFVPMALLLVGLTPLMGGRMILARLNPKGPQSPEWLALLALSVSALGCILFKPHPQVELGLLYGLGIFCGLLVAWDFRKTGLQLSRFIKEGEWMAYLFVKRPNA